MKYIGQTLFRNEQPPAAEKDYPDSRRNTSLTRRENPPGRRSSRGAASAKKQGVIEAMKSYTSVSRHIGPHRTATPAATEGDRSLTSRRRNMAATREFVHTEGDSNMTAARARWNAGQDDARIR